MKLFNKIIKEPLLHFFILGGVLFFVFLVLNPEDKQSSENIRIEASQVEYLSKQFEVKHGRVPHKDELKRLVDDYVNTEIYYREAVKLGLDKNDDVIKKHLRKKLRMMSSDTISLLDVNDTTLQKYIETHPENFTLPSMYRFYQVYIDPKKHQNDLTVYLKEVKEKLDNNISVISESKLVRDYYSRISKEVVSDIFGKDFYKELESAKFNTWSSVLKSDIGYHFIKLIKRTKSKILPLKDIRSYALNEYSKEKYRKSVAKQFQEMKKRYKIIVEKRDTIK